MDPAHSDREAAASGAANTVRHIDVVPPSQWLKAGKVSYAYTTSSLHLKNFPASVTINSSELAQCPPLAVGLNPEVSLPSPMTHSSPHASDPLLHGRPGQPQATPGTVLLQSAGSAILSDHWLSPPMLDSEEDPQVPHGSLDLQQPLRISSQGGEEIFNNSALSGTESFGLAATYRHPVSDHFEFASQQSNRRTSNRLQAVSQQTEQLRPTSARRTLAQQEHGTPSKLAKRPSQGSEKSRAAKRPKRGKKSHHEDLDTLMEDTRSPIYKEGTKIKAVVQHPKAISTLLDSDEGYGLALASAEELTTEIARFQENGRSGWYDGNWQRQAQDAHQARADGDFDDYQGHRFEQDWGESTPALSDVDDGGHDGGDNNGEHDVGGDDMGDGRMSDEEMECVRSSSYNEQEFEHTLSNDERQRKLQECLAGKGNIEGTPQANSDMAGDHPGLATASAESLEPHSRHADDYHPSAATDGGPSQH